MRIFSLFFWRIRVCTHSGNSRLVIRVWNSNLRIISEYRDGFSIFNLIFRYFLAIYWPIFHLLQVKLHLWPDWLDVYVSSHERKAATYRLHKRASHLGPLEYISIYSTKSQPNWPQMEPDSSSIFWLSNRDIYVTITSQIASQVTETAQPGFKLPIWAIWTSDRWLDTSPGHYESLSTPTLL